MAKKNDSSGFSRTKGSPHREADQADLHTPPDIENLLPLYDTGGLSYFGYRVALAAKLFDRRMIELLKKCGPLTLPQWRIIAQLGLVGTGTVRSLAEGAAVDRAEVSRTMRSLIDAGIVVRQENTSDQRRPTFCLTRSGTSLFKRVRGPISEFIAQLVADVPVQDIQAADRVLLAITRGATGQSRRL